MQATVTLQHLQVVVNLHPDYDKRAEDDCHSEQDRLDWTDDEWAFIAVEADMTVFLGPDMTITMNTTEALWGIEDANYHEGAATRYVNEEVIPMLVETCRRRFAENGVHLPQHKVQAVTPTFEIALEGQRERRTIDL